MSSKPVLNLDALTFERYESGGFAQCYASIAEQIGAQKLGYNLTVVAPKAKACPFHNHHVGEEMFFILEGEGLLRFGEQEYELRPNDVIACPPGGRDVAHQIMNTGEVDLKYLSVSTIEDCDVCEYPDSDKIGVFVGNHDQPALRKIYRAGETVSYLEGEG